MPAPHHDDLLRQLDEASAACNALSEKIAERDKLKALLSTTVAANAKLRAQVNQLSV